MWWKGKISRLKSSRLSVDIPSRPSPSFSRTWFFMMGHDFLRSRWCDWFQSLIKNFFSWNFSCSRKFCILRDTPYWTKPSCTSFNVNALIIIILTSVSQARLPFLGGEECGGETWWWNIKRVRVLSPPHMAWLCLQGVTKRKKGSTCFYYLATLHISTVCSLGRL